MNNEIKPPLWILLELTHKCPLEVLTVTINLIL